MQSTKQILTSRAHVYRPNSHRPNVIELPPEVDALIDDKKFRPRYRKLIELGYGAQIRQLAKYVTELPDDYFTHTRNKYFAQCCSKKYWEERTLPWLKKLADIARAASEVIQRIGVARSNVKAVYAACWRSPNEVIRNAVNAAEIGRDPFKLFCWLTWSASKT